MEPEIGEVYWSPFLQKWVKLFPCNCNNGYRGPNGVSCWVCEGNLVYEIIADEPPQAARDCP